MKPTGPGGLYDFVLLLTAVALLLALGLLALGGTVYAYLASLSDPRWAETPRYASYLARMNALAYPLVAGLLVTLALCIPRRLLRRAVLALVSATVLAASTGAGLAWGPRSGLTVLLLASALLQGVVLTATALRAHSLVWEREGQAARLGSALLHLGFVLFVLNVLVAEPGRLLGRPWTGAPPGLFTASAVALTAGLLLSFYPGLPSHLARLFRR